MGLHVVVLLIRRRIIETNRLHYVVVPMLISDYNCLVIPESISV